MKANRTQHMKEHHKQSSLHNNNNRINRNTELPNH